MDTMDWVSSRRTAMIAGSGKFVATMELMTHSLAKMGSSIGNAVDGCIVCYIEA